MSRVYNIRSMAKGNKAARGNTSAAPDNPGNSRIREEWGHEARAPSNNTTMMQKLALSSSHRSIEQGQNQTGSASSERPGNGCTMSNEARMMQMTILQGHCLTTLQHQTMPGWCKWLHHHCYWVITMQYPLGVVLQRFRMLKWCECSRCCHL